eukprot:GHVU01235304.1.p2 GENE.GHVU01235304.1~~GHVU01235304.1.p2  ORF type:complete len:160 (-),score=21.31 GHVU01235304.1:230-709(-)
MPLLGTLLIICMAFTAAALAVTVLILTVFNTNSQVEVPGWAKTVILNGMATLVCLRTKEKRNVVYAEEHNYSNNTSNKIKQLENVDKQSERNVNAQILDLIANYYRIVMDEKTENACNEKNRSDWQQMARILNRFFFVVFSCFFGIVIFMFILIIVWHL